MVTDAKVNQGQFAEWKSPQSLGISSMGGYSSKIDRVGSTSPSLKPYYSKDIGMELAQANEIFNAKQKKTEFTGSQAFRLEYSPETPRQAIIDDIVTYLGEYRLQAKETYYDLIYSEGPDGLHVRDAKRGVAMIKPAKKAVERGDKLERRKAELRALEIEDKLLETAEDGNILIQASPPGKIVKEDGSYGFIFISKVEKIDDKHKIIHKNAVRIDDATLEQYNQALSDITGLDISHTSAEGHIGDPHFLGNRVPYQKVLNILHKIFDFSPSAWERRRNEWIIEQTQPYIDYLADMIKQESMSGEEAFSFLEKIENHVLELKKSYTIASTTTSETRKDLSQQQLDDFNNRYNYKPPVTGGSCGSTGNGELPSFARVSNASFKATSSFQGIGEDEYGSLSFNCPHCGFLNIRDRGKFIAICGENAPPEQGCGESVKC